MVVPDELLQSWQVNRMMNLELSFHVKDNSPSSQSLLLRQILLVPVKLLLRKRMTILTAFNASPGSIAVISACSDSEVLDDSVKLFLFMADTVVAESRDNRSVSRRSCNKN